MRLTVMAAIHDKLLRLNTSCVSRVTTGMNLRVTENAICEIVHRPHREPLEQRCRALRVRHRILAVSYFCPARGICRAPWSVVSSGIRSCNCWHELHISVNPDSSNTSDHTAAF